MTHCQIEVVSFESESDGRELSPPSSATFDYSIDALAYMTRLMDAIQRNRLYQGEWVMNADEVNDGNR